MDDEELFADLSLRLRDAHRAVAALDWPDEEKARATRHLLAISDATKHDLSRASRRLDVFMEDLREGRRPQPREG
ncbi:MAG: SCO5555 family protein [Mycobacteriales bacterium]